MIPQKLLILIVAYNAENTIASVLRRIPVKRLPADTEVLIIDDCSTDNTFATAQEHIGECHPSRTTVLKNSIKQEYGGSQKLGYEFAIQHRFDVIVLLDGDGQYAPEKIPELIRPVVCGQVDACFGSRMIKNSSAIRKNMPLYKYLSNRILTIFQNYVLKTNLSEFHSGYRVYSVAALSKVPFSYNTNNFLFDTEIIVQFLMAGLRIKELPIPAYYGDKKFYGNGMAYAWNVLRLILANRIHRVGLLYQRKFDVRFGKAEYTLKSGYLSSHSLAIEAVPPSSTVLDLACGEGYVAAELARKQCRVTGVDRYPPAMNSFENFFLHDLDNGELPKEIGTYDYILALDCIEHFSAPEHLMACLRQKCYAKNTHLILTTPNIGFVITRLGLLFGQFNYGLEGILDLTHKRLFTFRSIKRLLGQEGYRILDVKGVPPPFPKAMGNNVISRLLMSLGNLLVFVWPEMFSYQVYIEASPLPPLEQLLTEAIEASV